MNIPTTTCPVCNQDYSGVHNGLEMAIMCETRCLIRKFWETLKKELKDPEEPKQQQLEVQG